MEGQEHLERVARTLRIEPERWLRVLDRYAASSSVRPAAVEARLRALHAAYCAERLDAAPLAGQAGGRSCPACLEGWLAPRFARRTDSAAGPSLFVYGRCGGCGHGLLLSEPAPEGVYASAAYFERQDESGAGYAGYEAERDYRIGKGKRLLDRIAIGSGRPVETLLEIGSGFGFTRAAAAGLGLETMGIDPNPAAAAAASRLFGMETIVGTLDSALAAGAVRPGTWDAILYDFVLEHVADPEAELRRAASLMSPGGLLVLVVPNMAAAEVEVFGGDYRSFRSDHLHIFSTESLERLLGRAGLSLSAAETGCTVHLLREVLTEEEVLHLYAKGKGPDLTIVARLSRH